MTRFRWTTLLTALAITAAVYCFTGGARYLAVALPVTIYAILFALGVAVIRMRYFCDAVCHGAAGQMRVALTFDDGPDPISTPPLLDLLRRENVSATFFLIGRNVDAHPEIARRICAEGHLVGNHTFNHYWSTSLLFPRALTREISLAQDAIARACGAAPHWFRPPVGLTNPHFHSVLRRMGLKLAGWDVRPMDTARPQSEVISRVLHNVRDGSIILLHDGAGRQDIAQTVAQLITALRRRGFSLARVDEITAPNAKRHPITCPARVSELSGRG